MIKIGYSNSNDCNGSRKTAQKIQFWLTNEFLQNAYNLIKLSFDYLIINEALK